LSNSDPNFQRVQDKYPPRLPPEYLNLDDQVKKLTGLYQPIANQGYVGRCTAEAFSEATKMRFACLGERLAPSSEWLYGKARTRLKRPNNGPPGTGLGDVALIAKMGFVPRAKYPGYDLRFDQVNLALAWEKVGPPDTLDPQAKRRSIGLLALTREEVLTSLSFSLPVVFAAPWYFTRTDSKGMLQRTGIKRPLSHAMVVQGYLREGGREYLCIRNQMGTKIFTGKQHPKFPVRGTGLLPLEEFNFSGVMFAVMGDR
jgi:hypothetical protein